MKQVLVALALGCVALGAAGCAEKPDEQFAYDGGTMTWNRDVLPIVQRRCQGCHVEDGIAPFPLTSYTPAAYHSLAMASAVRERHMPPWMPAEGPHAFRDSRRLSQGEIDVIGAWSDQGALEGDPADAPPPAEPAPGLAWTDQVIAPAEPYTPLANVNDDYHCFVLDPGTQDAKDLVGFEVQPGVPRMVHHMLLFAVPRQAALDRDAQDSVPGWTCFGDTGVSGEQLVGVWAPGTPPTHYPEGTGIRVPEGSVYVMQVHYNLHYGTRDPDQTHVALQYAHEPIKRPAILYPVIDNRFAVPPLAQGYSHSTSQYVPSGTLWGVMPHMHTQGRRIQVWLAGDPLIDIPAWNFHWQQNYFYVNEIPMPIFSEVKLTCTWDNTTMKKLTWGNGTEDEMCLAYLYITR